MLVEHSFISTREVPAAVAATSTLLQSMGFRLSGPFDAHVEASRGVSNPARAKAVNQLPQHVRVEFDRGRVSVAASVQEYRKAGELHRHMLLALVCAVEGMLGQNLEPDQARLEWDGVEQRIDDDHRRRRRSARIQAVVAIVLILASVAVVAWVLREN